MKNESCWETSVSSDTEFSFVFSFVSIYHEDNKTNFNFWLSAKFIFGKNSGSAGASNGTSLTMLVFILYDCFYPFLVILITQ